MNKLKKRIILYVTVIIAVLYSVTYGYHAKKRERMGNYKRAYMMTERVLKYEAIYSNLVVIRPNNFEDPLLVTGNIENNENLNKLKTQLKSLNHKVRIEYKVEIKNQD